MIRSTNDLVSRLDLITAQLAIHDEFGGRKLRPGHVINALVHWLVTADEAEVRRFVGERLRELERYMDQPEEMTARGGARSEPAPATGKARTEPGIPHRGAQSVPVDVPARGRRKA